MRKMRVMSFKGSLLGHYGYMAGRMFVRYRSSTAINVGGLVLGFTSCLLILIFARFETGYDRFWPTAENLYRVETRLKQGEASSKILPLTSPALAPALSRKIAAVKKTARLTPSALTIISKNDRFSVRAAFVDQGFFELFPPVFLHGNASTVLKEPNNIILTKTQAIRLFGRVDVLGKTVEAVRSLSVPGYSKGAEDKIAVLRVAGVIEDSPSNAHFSLQLVAPLNSPVSPVDVAAETNWVTLNTYTYFQAFAGMKETDFLADLKRLTDQGFLGLVASTERPSASNDGQENGERRNAGKGNPKSEVEKTKTKIQSPLSNIIRPVVDIHFGATEIGQLRPPGDQVLVRSLIAVSFFILAISLANFINIQLAILSQRLREVGLRRLLGASPSQLVAQLLAEAAILVAFAAILSIALAELLLPQYGSFIGEDLSSAEMWTPSVIGIAVALFAMTAVLGAGYPAYLLARHNPGTLFSNSQLTGATGAGIARIALVSLQFGITLFLVITTFVINAQTQLARNFDRGLSLDNVLTVSGINRAPKRLQALKNSLETLGEIEKVTFTSKHLPILFANALPVWQPGAREEGVTTDLIYVDPGYAQVMGLTMLYGRWHSVDHPSDALKLNRRRIPKGSAVISQTLAVSLGYGSKMTEIIGARLAMTTGSGRPANLEIVGVVDNAHYGQAREHQGAMVYLNDPSVDISLMLVKFSAGSGKALVHGLKTTILESGVQGSIKVASLGDAFAELSVKDILRSRVFTGFSFLAILISCFGLYGVIGFFIQKQRTEIALRKMFGGSTVQILILLVSRFSAPLVPAFIGAAPLAYFYNKEWIEKFSEQIVMGPGTYVTPFVIVLTLVVATCFSLVFRAIRQRPASVFHHD